MTVTASRDLTVEAEVRAFLFRFRRAAGRKPGRITIDLSTVEIADTKIVAALVDAYQTARRAMITLQIVPSESVRRVVHLCRLDPMLEQLQPAD